MEEKDRAFLIIKHEGIQRSLIGEIISRLEKKGLKIIGLKMFCMTEDDVRKLYDNCLQLPFFDEMREYNANHPVIGIVAAGPDANKGANEVCGKIGVPGTVRGDLALCHARNVLHCSDEDATDREAALFFKETELFAYKHSGVASRSQGETRRLSCPWRTDVVKWRGRWKEPFIWTEC